MKDLSTFWRERVKQKIQEKLSDRIFIVRFMITIFVIDFVAFLSLSSISPLELLNPFHFLKKRAQDERTYITLYFPSSLPFQEDKLLAVKEPVLQLPVGDPPDREKLLFNARQILLQLELGANNLKARRLLKEENNFLYVWYFQGGLVIKVNQEAWQKMSQMEKDLALLAIEKTLKENLPISYVYLDFSSG